MTTSLDIADKIGRKKLADALHVLPTAVSNAVVRGYFPSSWVLVVKALADEVGQDCPPELFKLKTHNPRTVDKKPKRQAAPAKKTTGVA